MMDAKASTWQEDLAKPFPPDQISYRPGAKSKDGTKAQKLAYIDARDVMNRLDLVLGSDGWSDSYSVIDAVAHVVECRLLIRVNGDGDPHYDAWLAKTDVGYPNSASDGDEKEPFKAAYSDAFKRAAVKWGIGRHLYDMPATWAPINQYGRFV